MKLLGSTGSPYARKARIVALETNLDLELVPTSVWENNAEILKNNPLSKIRCLLTDDGPLYDSPVICEYLDGLHSGHKLLPTDHAERFRQLRLAALADGIMDASLALRVEKMMRPEEKRWDIWIERQEAAITRSLDHLEETVGRWGGVFLMGPIAVVCALGYIDFRELLDWRAGRPHLTHWYNTVQNRRSVKETIAA